MAATRVLRRVGRPKGQRSISEYPDNSEHRYKHPEVLESVHKRMGDFCDRYPMAGLMLRPKERRIVAAPKKIDELGRYKIFIGMEEKYNFDEFLRQGGDEMIPLRKISGYAPKFSFLLSANRDAYGSLQSDHVFLSGSTGMGKTNLCSLLAIGFPRRPNPTHTIWVAQKTSTASMDFHKVGEALASMGLKYNILHLGRDTPEGRLPIQCLQLDDIKRWWKLEAGTFSVLQGIYQSFKHQGGGLARALEEFVEHKSGMRYQPIYEATKYGNIFSFAKKDNYELKKNHTTFLDISNLIKTESNVFADAVTNGWLNYLYDTIAQRRADLAPELAADPEAYKKQWQGAAIFDEFYELATGYRFESTMKTVTRIGTQGRQEGTGLVVATQTVFGTGKEKIPLSQAHHIFQFKQSSMSDLMFVMRTLGWEKSEYEFLLREIFSNYFPPGSGSKDKFKGRVLMFSKETSSVRAVTLKLLKGKMNTQDNQE